MQISLCLITKNEEATIERCIESVKEIVNEIVLVDTGSNDKTIEIAKNIGANIYNFKWIDDFSAARNFALTKAKGDWIIFLDGDEYIDKKQALLAKKYIKEAEKKGLNALLSGLININSTNGQFQSSSKTIRIFKNKEFIRYKGKIHETLFSKKGPLRYYDVSNSINIFHTGYTPNVVKDKEKSKRNLKILLNELVSNPNTDTHFYIAESLMIEGHYNTAISHLEEAIKLNNGKINGILHRCYSDIFTCMYENKSSTKELFEVYQRAMQLDNNYPDFDFFLGLKELDEKNYPKSIEFFNLCLNKIEQYNYDFESRTLTEVFNIYRTLINLNIVTKNYSEVIKLGVNILKVEKYDYNTLYIITDILLKNEQIVNVYDFLLNLYDKDLIKDKLYLLKVAESINSELFYSKILSLFSDEEKRYVAISKVKNENVKNYKVLLENEFKDRVNRIKNAKKQHLKLRENKNDSLHIVYVMTHVGVCGGVKIILEHANRLTKLGLDVTLVSHYPKPSWYNINSNYIEVPFDVELATGIPECDVIVATYWDHIYACIETEIAPVIYFEQGDFHLYDSNNMNENLKNFIYQQYQLPEFIFTVSNQTSKVIKQVYNRDAMVIHNAIDPSLFNNVQNESDAGIVSYILT